MTWYLIAYLIVGLGFAEFLVRLAQEYDHPVFRRPKILYLTTVILWPYPTFWGLVGLFKVLAGRK